MNITLKSDLVKALGPKKLAVFTDIEEDNYRWERDLVLDLSSMTQAKALKLQRLFEAHATLRGAKLLAQDTATWLAALQNGGNEKVRKLEKLPAFLKQYLKGAPKHWVYEFDEVAGFWQPYLVYDIQYHDAQPRNGIPAKVIMSMAYTELGLRKTRAVSFEHGDVVGRMPVEVLGDAGFIVESPDKLAAYEKTCRYYETIHDKVGKQFLAVGEARAPGRWDYTTIRLDRAGVPANVVVDVLKEEGEDRRDTNEHVTAGFWRKESADFEGSEDDDEDDIRPEDVDDEAEGEKLVIPLSPIVPAFDLRRHQRLRVNVAQLTAYVYDTALSKKLILPKESTDLVTMLVAHNGGFKDIIGNKSGGAIILCAGKPGTGKTLTAEVYAEAMQRPLYSVQCSQLGVDPEELEKELMLVFARAQRWKAILLLDEADVYVAARGSDLTQNAIVGVFLRVLEYYGGVLFLTTNRADLVDDAVASRCIARIDYDVPTVENQKRIWRVLADTAGTELPQKVIDEVVRRHARLSGRDVKNLLKLVSMVSISTGKPITADSIDFVKRFKPTGE